MNSDSSSPSVWVRLRLAVARMRFFSFSLLLHVIIVIICGSAVLIQQTKEPPDFVAESGSFMQADPSALPPHVEPPVLDQVTPVAPSPSNNSSPNVSVLTTTSATSNFSAASAMPTATGKGIADAAKKAGQMGMGPGGPMAKGGTAMRFFGVQAKVDSVVFVVDVSGSMIGGQKSVKTYEVLEREIGKVIRELTDKTLFGIVVFSRDAMPFKPELVRATREEKDRAYNWMKKMSPEQAHDPRATEEEKTFHRGTRADKGLAMAFEMKPDAIFFVSDGEPTGAPPPKILEQVEAAQTNRPARAVVNTIAYLADGGQEFMENLAKKNGGTFREVNPKDVR